MALRLFLSPTLVPHLLLGRDGPRIVSSIVVKIKGQDTHRTHGGNTHTGWCYWKPYPFRCELRGFRAAAALSRVWWNVAPLRVSGFRAFAAVPFPLTVFFWIFHALVLSPGVSKRPGWWATNRTPSAPSASAFSCRMTLDTLHARPPPNQPARCWHHPPRTRREPHPR
jgi:hypothetical protein